MLLISHKYQKAKSQNKSVYNIKLNKCGNGLNNEVLKLTVFTVCVNMLTVTALIVCDSWF